MTQSTCICAIGGIGSPVAKGKWASPRVLVKDLTGEMGGHENVTKEKKNLGKMQDAAKTRAGEATCFLPVISAAVHSLVRYPLSPLHLPFCCLHL